MKALNFRFIIPILFSLFIISCGGETSTPISNGGNGNSGGNSDDMFFTADFIASTSGLTVSFTNKSSLIFIDREIASYSWDFGDGSSSTEENPLHKYATKGNYTVTLTVADNLNNVKTKTATFTLSNIFTSIVSGAEHTLALTEDGRVYAWGSNDIGQLGLGDNVNYNTPQEVTFFDSGKKVVTLSAGGNQSFAITDNGKVYAWGNNANGQLGLGDNVNYNTPQEVTELSSKNIKAIASGSTHTLALTNLGTVYSFGSNSVGELGLGDNVNYNTPKLVTIPSPTPTVKLISASNLFSLFITTDNNIYSSGNNEFAQLGFADNNNRLSPTHITGYTDTTVDIKSVATGYAFSFVIRADGSVYTWGYNGVGALGIGSNSGKVAPTLITTFPAGTKIISVKSGSSYSVAISESGKVYSWGSAFYAQLGYFGFTGQPSPKEITALPANIKPTIISTGSGSNGGHTSIIAENGLVYTWGINSKGQLGTGSRNTEEYLPIILNY